MNPAPERTPVIVGVGEVTDRPADFLQSLEPLALMVEATQRADEDARGLLRAVDSIDIVGLVSWRYENTPAQLCEKLGVSPRRSVYGDVGGESPIRFLHEAARRIAQGESETSLVVGAEAQYAVNHAKRANLELGWTTYAVNAPKFKRAADYVNPLGVRMGVAWPINVYPFYDAGNAHHLGLSPRAALSESGRLWSAYSKIAAANPYAWSQKELRPEEITTPSPDNRLVSWPYTKRMVANPNVNQGAAVIMTSLARARAAGIAEDRLVFVGLGAHANEPRDWLARPQYCESHAQRMVLESMLRQFEADHSQSFDLLELYSCFPVVPKLARRTLQRAEDVAPSVAGGLSFFGGPLNNYMTHAACAMVRGLRSGARHGLLYGQGEFVTKHYGLALARTPLALNGVADVTVDACAQARAEPYLGPPIRVEDAPDCEASIETFTVLYDPSGAPLFGAVIARIDAHTRTLARTRDADDIAMLTCLERYPIGVRGRVTTGADGLPEWRTSA